MGSLLTPPAALHHIPELFLRHQHCVAGSQHQEEPQQPIVDPLEVSIRARGAVSALVPVWTFQSPQRANWGKSRLFPGALSQMHWAEYVECQKLFGVKHHLLVVYNPFEK